MLCFKIIILNFIFCKEIFKNFIIQTVAKVIYVQENHHMSLPELH